MSVRGRDENGEIAVEERKGLQRLNARRMGGKRWGGKDEKMGHGHEGLKRDNVTVEQRMNG